MQILNNPISALNVRESPKFTRGRWTRWWRQIFHWKWKYGRLAHAQWKICNITLIYGRIAEIFASLKKSGPRNTWWRQILDRKWKYSRFAHAQWKIRNITLMYVRESPKFSRLKGNWGWGTRWWRQILDRKWKYGRFTHAQCIRP